MSRTTAASAPKGASKSKPATSVPASTALLADILAWLDEAKAEDVISIPLAGKSTLGDFMVVASGRNDRHVGAVAEQLREKIKARSDGPVRVEGLSACDWVLIDTGDIIIHVFRPEVREFYNLEKMWKAELPPDTSASGSGEPSAH